MVNEEYNDVAEQGQAQVEAIERPEIAEADSVQAVVPSPVLYKFTNQVESPELDDLLALFYRGIYANSVGIMQAHNLDTGEEELILVGVNLDEDGKADCYPLAVCLSVENTRKYLAPDGKGGFYDPRDPSDAAAAKENMKSYTDAVVE